MGSTELQQCEKCREEASPFHCETLPLSGQHCTFKGPTIGIMKKMMKGALPVLAGPNEGSSEREEPEVEFGWDDCFDMICALSQLPKFIQEDEAGKGEALIDDLDVADFTALVRSMTAAAGMTKAAMQADPT